MGQKASTSAAAGRVAAGRGAHAPRPKYSRDVTQTYYRPNWQTTIGIVVVHVKGAAGVKPMDLDGKSDPFCVITFGQQSFRTRTIHDSLNPTWDQLASIIVDETQATYSIGFNVYDKDELSKDDFIGGCDVSIAGMFERGGIQDYELPLKDKRQHVHGKLIVSIEVANRSQVASRFWENMSDIFDSNKDGEISKDELAVMLQTLGSTATEEQINEFIERADTNHDGVVSREELYNFLSSENTGLRFIDMEQCPVTGQSMVGWSDNEKVLHLAQMFANKFDSPDRLMIGEYLCGSNKVTWLKQGNLVKNSASYSEEEGKGYILVQDRLHGKVEKEKLAPFVTAPLRLMYQTMVGRLATDKAKHLLIKMSVTAGAKYDDPESVSQIPQFVSFYGLNTDEMLLSLDEYKTFNEFFFRKLKPDARPIHEIDNPSIAVSPADCRCLTFPLISESTRLWIKGKQFSVSTLVQDAALASRYEGGSLVIARLAPQDYHRFHFPVTGKVLGQRLIGGTLYTVSPLAVNQDVNVYTENKRAWTLVETAEFGNVLIVTIGATMVGSIMFTAGEGTHVRKGDEHGYFAFGGSTEILLFEPNRIAFDNDLLRNSCVPIETLIRMGQSLGTATGGHSSPTVFMPAAAVTYLPSPGMGLALANSIKSYNDVLLKPNNTKLKEVTIERVVQKPAPYVVETVIHEQRGKHIVEKVVYQRPVIQVVERVIKVVSQE